MSAARRHVDLTEHRDHDDVDVVEMVDELVDPHIHREAYAFQPVENGPKWHRDHQTRIPPLLEQLEHSMPSGGADVAVPRGFASRPAARLEALDALIRIDHEATELVKQIDPTSAPPATTTAAVRRVASLLPRLPKCYRHRGRVDDDGKVDCCRWHDVEDQVRGWWAQARVMAGWDTPAWQPNGTCPVCGKLGTLRIRVSAKTGFCTSCRAHWQRSTIELLGEHIRVEAFQRSADRVVEPCWCPWPTPIERMGPLCRRCGSARCHRAVTAALVTA